MSTIPTILGADKRWILRRWKALLWRLCESIWSPVRCVRFGEAVVFWSDALSCSAKHLTLLPKQEQIRILKQDIIQGY